MGTYTLGPSRWHRHARLDTKPSAVYGVTPDGSVRRDTGGGYERIRSWEHDPTKPGDGKTDVYASHHRLLWVAWHYPDDEPLDLSALDGMDVHHDAPEIDGSRGVEWDNRENCFTLLDHGRHSEVTQSEVRAWAEDDKRRVDGDVPSDRDECVRCGETPDVACESPDWDGVACMDCSQDLADGEPIEVVG